MKMQRMTRTLYGILPAKIGFSVTWGGETPLRWTADIATDGEGCRPEIHRDQSPEEGQGDVEVVQHGQEAGAARQRSIVLTP
jgi:hypothetical protein